MKLLLNQDEMIKMKEMISIGNDTSYEEMKKLIDSDPRYKQALEIFEHEDGTVVIDIKPWITVGLMEWYNKYSRILIPIIQSLFEIYSSATEELSSFIQENVARINKSFKRVK